MCRGESLNMILDEISKFDDFTEPFYEYQVAEKIKLLLEKESTIDKLPEYSWEIQVFHMNENETNDSGNYFSPYMPGVYDSTPKVESGLDLLITKDCYIYMQNRAESVKHPVLKYRYSMLCWEAGKLIRGFETNPAMAIIAIESSIEIAEKKLYYDIYIFHKLIQAFKVAKTIKNTEMIDKARDAILNYENDVAEDSKPGLWGYSYDVLIENSKNNVFINDVIKTAIIDSLEKRLSRLVNVNDPWSAQHAALRLARYYRKLSNIDEMTRVLSVYADCLLNVSENSSGLQQASWLRMLHDIFIDFNMKEKAEDIAFKIQSVGEKINSEMIETEYSVEITPEQQEQKRKFLDEITSPAPPMAFKNIASSYIVRKGKTEAYVNKVKNDFIAWHIASTEITDHKGCTIAHIGIINDDFDGHVIKQMADNIGLYAPFLREVIDAFFSKYLGFSAENIVDYLYSSPVFDKSKRSLIKKGIELYLNKEYMLFIHLMVPLIEDSIRNFAQDLGCSVIKRNRYGGYQYKNFDELLREEKVLKIVGSDFVTYFKVLFTDQRGWNIRNNICHGLFPVKGFNCGVADRVFHALLCLALLIPVVSSSTAEEETKTGE
jgi:Domain of unknown function (DUF4209)